MNEFIDRSMGFDWVKNSGSPCDYSTAGHAGNKPEPEFSAPRIVIEDCELVIKQRSRA